MKIFAFSDTHGMHNQLTIPEADLYICAGDVTNYKAPHNNYFEMDAFITWYRKLPGIKIFVPGNHDTSVSTRLFFMRDVPGIIFLEHEYKIIEGISFFGSPYTPEFCNWSYNASEEELKRYWKTLEIHKIDILVTHGPPFGIMDAIPDSLQTLEHVGDKELLKVISSLKVRPKYHIFGHIHDNKMVINSGKKIIDGITYMNVSCVTDGHLNKGLTSNGILFEY